MIAHVMLLGGDHNEEIVSVGTTDGEWPQEIRVAYGHEEAIDGKILSSVYIQESVDKWAGGMYLGAYRFVGMKPTAPTLIQMKIPTKE